MSQMSDIGTRSGLAVIPTNRPYFTDDDRRTICEEMDRILISGKLTMGPWVERLEQAVSQKTGARFVIATNSGTSALEILCRYTGVGEGDEVIVPTNTFVATANAVRLCGGTPVLADIRRETLALDPSAVRAAITPRTKGVITVHIAGMIAPDFEELRELCRAYGIFLFEDAAHAFGASASPGKAGTLADGAAFSLFPTKPVTAGEGGLLLTEDVRCADFARSYRCHGLDTTHREQRFIRLGNNFRMSEITALVGTVNVRRSNEAQILRDNIARFYLEKFAGSCCTLPLFFPNAVNAWFKFPLILPSESDGTIIRSLCFRAGVSCGTCYWPPVHRQPYYANDCGDSFVDRFPAAEDVLQRTIALPVFPGLSQDAMRRVADTVLKIVKQEANV